MNVLICLGGIMTKSLTKKELEQRSAFGIKVIKENKQ